MTRILSYLSKYRIYGLIALALSMESNSVTNAHVPKDKIDRIFTIMESEFLVATQNLQTLFANNSALFSELGRIKHKSDLQDIIIGRLTQENLELRRALYKANQAYPQPAFDKSQETTSTSAQLTHETFGTTPASLSAAIGAFNDRFTPSDTSLFLDNAWARGVKEITRTLSLTTEDLEFNLLQSHFRPHLPMTHIEPILSLTAELSTVVNRPVFTVIHADQEETVPTIIQNTSGPALIPDTAFMPTNEEVRGEQLEVQSPEESESVQDSESQTPPSLTLTTIQPEQASENESSPIPFLHVVQEIVESAFSAISGITSGEPDSDPILQAPLELLSLPQALSTDVGEEDINLETALPLAQVSERPSTTIETDNRVALEGESQARAENSQPLTAIEALRPTILETVPQSIAQPMGTQEPLVTESLREHTLPINFQAVSPPEEQPVDERINERPPFADVSQELAPLSFPHFPLQQNVEVVARQSSLERENETLKANILELEQKLQETRVLLMGSNVDRALPVVEPFEDGFEVSLKNTGLELDEDLQKDLFPQMRSLILERETLLKRVENLNRQFKESKTKNKKQKKDHLKLMKASSYLSREKKGSLEDTDESASPVLRCRKKHLPDLTDQSEKENEYLTEENKELRSKNKKLNELISALNSKIKTLDLDNKDSTEAMNSQHQEISALTISKKHLLKKNEELKNSQESLHKEITRLKSHSEQLIEDFKVVQNWVVWLNNRSLPQPQPPQTASREIEDSMMKILTIFNTIKHAQNDNENEERNGK
jgi:hypothetical protein